MRLATHVLRAGALGAAAALSLISPALAQSDESAGPPPAYRDGPAGGPAAYGHGPLDGPRGGPMDGPRHGPMDGPRGGPMRGGWERGWDRDRYDRHHVILGEVVSFRPFRLEVRRRNGDLQRIDLKRGTIISPEGATPRPGDRIAAVGRYSDGTFVVSRLVVRE